MISYRVEGYMKNGKKYIQINKEIVAKDKDDALERFYCLLGSNYGKKRRELKIEKVDVLDPENAKNPVVLYHLKKGEINGK
ncbi:MAG: 50S ribosomal protein L18Ae [Thermoplasmata archaeon]